MENSKDPWAWLGQNKKGIAELRAALNAAKTSDEMFRIFAKLEKRLQENQLGFDCSMMALQLQSEGKDPLKILEFGKRALSIFLRNENHPDLGISKSSMVIGTTLNTLGYACLELNRFNESLSYLNWSDRNLSKLLSDNYERGLVLKGLHDTQLGLSKLKKAMGRLDEVVIHTKKVLEIREKITEKGGIVIGKANRDVADACVEVGNFEEALPFALKALEMFKKHFSEDSEEVTMLRMKLCNINSVLGEHDKAIEHNRLSMSSLKSRGDTSLLLKAAAQGGQTLAALGRFEEVIEVLKPAISTPENAGNQRDRAIVYMTLARAFCSLGKCADARKYIKIAVRILEKKGLEVGLLATGLMYMSNLYEDMEEYEAAISLVQKALSTPKLPQDHLAKFSCRLFSLVFISGTEEKRLSSLEEVVETLIENFGPEHCHVFHVYVKLGFVYLKLGRTEMAAKILARAKDALYVSFGPYHLDSLIASQALSVAYEGMGSYDLAIKTQEQVVEGFKELGLSEQDIANNAVQTLNRMKRGATGEVAESHIRASGQSKDIEVLSAMISQCSVSDDGKVI